MPRYNFAGFVFMQTLLGTALILCCAQAARAQRPGTAQYTTILSFDKYSSDGNSQPNSALIADSSGNLYGTTSDADDSFGGGAFELTPAGDGTWTGKHLRND